MPAPHGDGPRRPGIGRTPGRQVAAGGRNAVQHGKPKRIGITLAERGGLVTLTVEDDGTGLPETAQKTDGLGIRIMAHRAAMIGGSFAFEPGPTGGTIVTCSTPKAPGDPARQPAPEHHNG